MLDGHIFFCYNRTEGQAETLDGAKMKDLKDVQLFDLYGALLTEGRREVCKLYYLCDLSLSEIAEEKGITKQAVSECVKKSRSQLLLYEKRLGFSKNLQQLTAAHPELEGEIAELIASGGREE